MKIRICIAIPAETFSDLVPMVRRAEDAGADLAEIRLDYMTSGASRNMDRLKKLVEQSRIPLIATNRQYEQGGHCSQDEEQRVKTLVKAAEIGFQYVDIELTTPRLEQTIEKIREYKAEPIVSLHDFDETPAVTEMEKTIKTQIKAGAEVCKLATTANDIEDNVRCMLVARKMSGITKVVCFAMGKKGVLSRALSPFFGAYFTYASLEDNLGTASGQMSIAKLRNLYERLGVN